MQCIFFAKTLSTIIFVANQLWYYSLLRVFTINTSSFSRFIICIAYSLWIHYLFPKIHSEFIIHYFNIFFVKILWIHFQFRKFTIFFANWLCINYILHWITMNQLSFFGKTLSISYLCRVFVNFHPNLPWIREKNINIPSFIEVPAGVTSVGLDIIPISDNIEEENETIIFSWFSR